MEDTIAKFLDGMAIEENITVLLAVESGSRAWSFPSPDSDWDLRFIYVKPLKDYLSVFKKSDHIELQTEEGLDAVGWDLQKALQLLSKSNCTLTEWLQSPIVYREKSGFREDIHQLALDNFSPRSGLYHYLNLATKNRVPKEEEGYSTLKKQLYCLRSLMACQWISREKTPPPMEIDTLIRRAEYDSTEKESIQKLLRLKKQTPESEGYSGMDVLEQLVKREINRFSEIAQNSSKAKRADLDAIDLFFQKWVVAK